MFPRLRVFLLKKAFLAKSFLSLSLSNSEEDAFDVITRLMVWQRMRDSVIRLGDLLDFGHVLKPLATINLPKSPTSLGNFCKGVKIYHLASEIIFGQLL